MAKLEFLQPLKTPLKYLRFLGLWKDQSVRFYRQVLHICLHLLVCEVYVSFQFINIISASNLSEFTEVLSFLANSIGFFIKSLHLIVKRKEIETLIEDAKELAKLVGTKNELRALQRQVKQAGKLYKFYFNFVLVATVLSLVAIAVTFIMHPEPPYKVPFNSWGPFDYEQNIYKFVTVAMYNIITSIVSSFAILSLDILPIYFISFSSGMIEELSLKMEKICDEETEEEKLEKLLKTYNLLTVNPKRLPPVSVNKAMEEAKKKAEQIKLHKARLAELEKCIEIHGKINKFVKKIEKIFSPVIFVQGAMSMIMLCTDVFVLSKVSLFQNFKII
jgi:7tm Odorant receptor